MSNILDLIKVLKEAKQLATGQAFPSMLQYLIEVALIEAEDRLAEELRRKALEGPHSAKESLAM